MKKARQLVDFILQHEPDFNAEAFAKKVPVKDQAIRDRIVETWKKAGHP